MDIELYKDNGVKARRREMHETAYILQEFWKNNIILHTMRT